METSASLSISNTVLLFCFFCVCICMFIVCRYVHMCVCMWRPVETTTGIYLSLPSHSPYFLTWSLSLSHWVSYTSWPASPRDPPVSTFPMLGLLALTGHAQWLYGYLGLKLWTSHLHSKHFSHWIIHLPHSWFSKFLVHGSPSFSSPLNRRYFPKPSPWLSWSLVYMIWI